MFQVACQSAYRAYEIAEPNMPFDAIIVPGVPYDTGWSQVMKMRVLWSVDLYKKGIAEKVIYSGSSVYTPYVEAKIMALYAQKLGVDPDDIIIEGRAEHSTENLWYGYHLAKEHGLENIALATDPFQNAMLKSFANRKDIPMDFVPVIIDQLKPIFEKTTVFIDPTSAYVDDFVSLPDRESSRKRWMGTMGLNIKKGEE
ncbi:MAG: hypothetical protein ACI85F_000179 [Bacteroidia bacterium]|jgi:hypothetical protein